MEALPCVHPSGPGSVARAFAPRYCSRKAGLSAGSVSSRNVTV